MLVFGFGLWLEDLFEVVELCFFGSRTGYRDRSISSIEGGDTQICGGSVMNDSCFRKPLTLLV